MFYGQDEGSVSTDVAYAIINEFGFDQGYITGQKPPVDSTGRSGTVGVIDMNTGRVIGDRLRNANEVLERVILANSF